MLNTKLKSWLTGVVCCIACVTCFADTIKVEPKEITLAATSFPPYFSDNLQDNGFISQLIKEAFSLAGYQIKVKFYPWTRALFMAREGLHEGVYTLWDNKERHESFYYSEGILENQVVLFVNSFNLDIPATYTEVNELENYTIGIGRNYAVPEEITELKLQRFDTTDDQTALRMLIAKRIDLVMTDRILGQYLLTHKFPVEKASIKIWGNPIGNRMQHLGISKKVKNSEQIIKEFNQGLQMLKENGRFAAIIQAYGFENPSQS